MFLRREKVEGREGIGNKGIILFGLRINENVWSGPHHLHKNYNNSLTCTTIIVCQQLYRRVTRTNAQYIEKTEIF